MKGAGCDRVGWAPGGRHPRRVEAGPSWRSVKDLLDFAGSLNERGIGFVSLADSIDTTAASGRFFFNVMASLARMERELMVERTQAGLQAAREQGRVGGRKRVMTEAKVRSARKLLGQGTPPREGLPAAPAFPCQPSTGGPRNRHKQGLSELNASFGAGYLGTNCRVVQPSLEPCSYRLHCRNTAPERPCRWTGGGSTIKVLCY